MCDLKTQYAIMNNRTNQKRAKERENIVYETFKAVETNKLVEDLKYEPWNLPPGLQTRGLHKTYNQRSSQHKIDLELDKKC